MRSKPQRGLVLKYVYLSLLVLAIFYTLTARDPSELIDAQSVKVIDGYTIDIDGGRFRLSGFDTPETYRAQCNAELQLGNRATDRLKQMVLDAGTIELRSAGTTDQYGRGIAQLMINAGMSETF